MENVEANNSDELKAHKARYKKLLNCVNINHNQIKNPRKNKDIKKKEFIKKIQLFYKNDISNKRKSLKLKQI